MGNLRFRRDQMGDVHWTFSEATEDEVEACRNDPTAWFNENIEGMSPFQDDRCENPEGNELRDTITADDTKLRIWGTCGTRPIYANGTSTRFMKEALAWRREQAPAHAVARDHDHHGTGPMVVQPNMREFRMANKQLIAEMDPNAFFDELDSILKDSIQFHSHGIEVRIWEVDKMVRIHAEVGFVDPVIRGFRAAVANHRGRFLEWLVRPTNQQIPRELVLEHESGEETRVALSPNSILDGSTAGYFEDPYPGTCTGSGCYYAACNVDSGDAVEYDMSTGFVHVRLEVLENKKYCRRLDGSTCR